MCDVTQLLHRGQNRCGIDGSGLLYGGVPDIQNRRVFPTARTPTAGEPGRGFFVKDVGLVEEKGLLELISFHQADVTDLPNLFDDSQFDVILCHNMIKFVTDAYALLKDMHTLLKPGGWLSITAVNPHSEVYRQAIFLNDLTKARNAIGQEGAQHPWFDKPERRHDPEDLINYLDTLGCTLLGHYGLRCIVDYLTDNEAKYDPKFFTELEKLEHDLTDRYPYYYLARMFHIIVRK
jgi:S-adenosylmethionine-dependent methyltransferase